MNDAKNRTKVSPRFAGNKRQNEVEKEIKPFKETIQLDESLIHDSELDIPLIIETLIYNKVMIKKNFDENKIETRERKKRY